MQTNRILAAFIVVMALLIPTLLAAQTEGETTAEVTELSEFHTVIFKIWHEAWPAKDVSMLRSLLPAIDSGAAKVRGASLPGILREKKTLWDENIKALGAIVENYRAAAASTDSQKLLDAAEQLHSQYEKLVRTIRPALKELDAFHQVLYKVYHYALPAGDTAAIRKALPEFEAAMGDLMKASLPKRLAAKEKDFTNSRSALAKSLQGLATSIEKRESGAALKVAVENLHSKYQALERIF